MNRTTKKVLWLVFGLGISIGIVSVKSERSFMAYAEERYQDLQLFAKVLNLVQQYYVEEVDTKKLIYGGISGMLRELDPHTNFLPPDIYKEFESETTGEFGGLGIEITLQKGVLTVISPIEDTPAWKAGIKAGDKIIEIDGESTKGLSLAEAAQKMKGRTSSKVKLGIFRDGFEQPRTFVIERGVVKIKSVKYVDLNEGYGYIRLTSFIENSASDMEKAIKAHEKKHGDTQGLVLDLRRNPGGLLDQAVQISDLFLEQGVIVSTMGRNKKEKEVLYARKAGTLKGFPLVVLIDEYSASASEILAGALKDHKRAIIMGQRSFGKGSVQSVVKLGDGSGLKLTVGRYYTPSGRSIQAEGIVPDVEVDDLSTEVLQQINSRQQARREKDMQGHLLGEAEVAEKSKDEKKSSGIMPFWWSDDADKKNEKELSPREKLLREDFPVIQAYSYLKAWHIMRNSRGDSASAGEATKTPPAAESLDVQSEEGSSSSEVNKKAVPQVELKPKKTIEKPTEKPAEKPAEKPNDKVPPAKPKGKGKVKTSSLGL